MDQALVHQAIQLKTKISEERMQRLLDLAPREFYQPLDTNISHFAIRKLHDQQLKAARALKAEEELPPYTGYHVNARGIPCSHVIYEKLVTEQLLSPNEFYSHWRIKGLPPLIARERVDRTANQHELQTTITALQTKFPSSAPHGQLATLDQLHDVTMRGPTRTILPPDVASTKGRRIGSKNRDSTAREKSLYEHIEMEMSGSIRRCGRCKRTGHNSRTCPVPTGELPASEAPATAPARLSATARRQKEGKYAFSS